MDSHEWTDKQIERLEREIAREYRRAKREMSEKLEEHKARFAAAMAERAKGMTPEGYAKWIQGQVATEQWFSDMIDSLAMGVSGANERAMAIVNGKMPETVAYCANYATYQIEQASSINTMWTMVNEDSVRTLIADNPSLLPKVKTSGADGVKWNAGKFRSAITQGLLQGESIPNVSKRLQSVLGMNQTSAVRAARTAMTSAESAGSLISYKRAEAMGIKVMSEWRSTLDERTRMSHRAMMGERVRPGKKFSNGLTRPGDPSGPAEEVYNCRCALVPWIGGIDYSKSDQWFYDETINGQSFEEWGGKRRDYSHQRAPQSHTVEELEDKLGKAQADFAAKWSAYKKKPTYAGKVDAMEAAARAQRVETQLVQLKAEHASSIEVVKAELEAAQEALKVAKQELKVITDSIAALDEQIPQDKVYVKLLHGKPEVKLSDWTPSLAAEIEDSYQFYGKKAAQAKAAGDKFDVDWYEKKQAQCLELNVEGKSYRAIKEEVEYDKKSFEAEKKEAEDAVKEAQDNVNSVKAKLKEIDPEFGADEGHVYGQARWDAAQDFSRPEDADALLRPEAGRVWREATTSERMAINEYTGGRYTEYNRPLNGYERSYSVQNFKGVGVADINEGGYGNKIRRMTDIIERSRISEDILLSRGDGYSSLNDLFGFEPKHFSNATTQEEWDDMVGRSGRIGSFMSCGSAHAGNTGFTNMEVKFHIFAPEGTHAMYVEPISRCGAGPGLKWDGVSNQRTFGREDETIIQRGGSYTCTKAEKRSWGLEIWLEHHPEDGYDLFQQ